MKKIFYFLFFIFISFTSYTQSFIDKNFWQIHINETTNDAIYGVFEADSFYYFYGLKNQYSAEAYPFILKVNNDGEIVKSVYYENEFLLHFFYEKLI